jgi:phosphatidylglycerophosphate synthase
MLTLPNLLTLSRILAVPILVFLLWKPAPWDYAITFVLYCIVGIADKIMVAAVLVMLMASRKADGDAPIIQDWSVIPAIIILIREIMVSGLREYLAGLQVSVPVSALAKWKTTFQLVALGALILGGAFPSQHWIHLVGLSSLWAAAALTLVTGWDYLRVGLEHMD